MESCSRPEVTTELPVQVRFKVRKVFVSLKGGNRGFLFCSVKP